MISARIILYIGCRIVSSAANIYYYIISLCNPQPNRYIIFPKIRAHIYDESPKHNKRNTGDDKKTPPFLTKQRCFWYARCDSNAWPLESESNALSS